jgi:hypothetical protein
MPGLLITPERYFLDLFDKPKRDFAGWQMSLLDRKLRYVFCAEIATLVYDKETNTLSMQCAWATRERASEKPERLSGIELNLSLSCADLYGSSSDDGGGHFEPGLEATTRFSLYPPGTFETSESAETWQRVKALGLGAAQ